jgi:hypothetical protein
VRVVEVKTSHVLIWSTILLLLFVVPPHPAIANSQTAAWDITCEYAFSGTRISNTSTIHYQGQQRITLLSLDHQSIRGDVSWNISMDGGLSWNSFTETYTFNPNRTYQHETQETYTAWWIDTAVKVGDSIPIDGDFPVTNHLARSMPFLVTDLLSLNLGASHYTCWWLKNDDPVGVHESFYYELGTGLLVAAYSEVSNGLVEYQVQMELQSTNPALPRESLFTHLLLTYGSLVFPLVLASLASLGAYLLLRTLRRRRITNLFSPNSRRNP